MTGQRDISDRADCEALVRAFYGRALTDPMIGFLFKNLSRLVFAFTVCVALYGYFFAGTEYGYSTFFYHFAVGSILSVLYMSNVHGGK